MIMTSSCVLPALLVPQRQVLRLSVRLSVSTGLCPRPNSPVPNSPSGNGLTPSHFLGVWPRSRCAHAADWGEGEEEAFPCPAWIQKGLGRVASQRLSLRAPREPGCPLPLDLVAILKGSLGICSSR